MFIFNGSFSSRGASKYRNYTVVKHISQTQVRLTSLKKVSGLLKISVYINLNLNNLKSLNMCIILFDTHTTVSSCSLKNDPTNTEERDGI